MTLELPPHVYLHLMHNDHKSEYTTIASANRSPDLFISDWDRDMALKHDEMWEMCWYEDAFVGDNCPRPRRRAAYDIKSLIGIDLTLPKHLVFHIDHNEPRLNGDTVADDYPKYDNQEWVSGDDYLEAYHNNEMWSAQWYPNTPIGFYVVRAHTLENLLAYLGGLS